MYHAILAGGSRGELATALAGSPFEVRLLVNADPVPDSAAIITRCQEFAGRGPGLIVTLLPTAAPGLAAFPLHAAVATLWAFTRQAALEWAPRKIRVNAIGLGAAPFGPSEAAEQAGRGAAEMPALSATVADIARTVRAIADFPSMTGQIIHLGA